LGSALVLASGCGTIALKQSFDNYSDTYAETQNRQMLENLARLSNREPIYFFQLAQISAGYTFTETASIGDTHERGLTNSPLKNAAGPTGSTGADSFASVVEGPMTNFRNANASIGGTAVHNPIFTLVPLGGDKFAAQLLAPIKPQIFYELFEEGWPIDLLMRVLIQRIELVNVSPTRQASTSKGAGEALEILINNPLECNGGHYDRFLRACALSREFQKRGILYLDISDKFEPLSKNTVFPYPPTDQQQLSAEKEGLVWKQVPEAEDIDPLADKAIITDPEKSIEPPQKEGSDSRGAAPREHGSQELATGNWRLGKSSQQSLFKLNQLGLLEASQELGLADDGKDTGQNASVFAGNDGLAGKFKLVLASGIGVTDAETSKSTYHVRLVMRSLLGSMLALANEQTNYKVFDIYRNTQEMHDRLERIKALKLEIQGIEGPEKPMDAQTSQLLAVAIVTHDTAVQEKAEIGTPPPDAKADVKAAAKAVDDQIASATADIERIEGAAHLTDEAKKRQLADDIVVLQGYIDKGVDNVPMSEDHPVLTLTWPATGTLKWPATKPPPTPMDFDPDTKVASVGYNKQHYIVADHKGLFVDNQGLDDPILDTWNRDVFRLLVQLSLQVTADPSTFALPSLLQSSH
jgi:hypothetical protein